MRCLVLFAWFTFLFISHLSLAQPTVKTHVGSVRTEFRVNENTLIIDKKTKQQISYQTYEQLIKDDQYGYHLEPIIDEYGDTKAYTLRPTTPKEKETHSFDDRDLSQRPKAGEPMPEFVMKGMDGKVYRLAELKGHVVILSFWISLSKPFWGPNQAKTFANVLKPYQLGADPISLGILQESKQNIADVMASETLPFIAIPDSYNFHRKFQVTTAPTFIVIDRAGKVAAFLEGSNFTELQKALQTASR